MRSLRVPLAVIFAGNCKATHEVSLHVDGQRDADLARRLGVRGFPAVIVLSAGGQITGRVDGYRDPAEMQAFLVRHGGFRERSSE